MKFAIETDHPNGDRLLKAALENYAAAARFHAQQVRNRETHPGETDEAREHRAKLLDVRADASTAMAAQIDKPSLGPPQAETA